MAYLIGLVVVLGTLYFWLVGHWFARVVAFLAWGLAFETLAVASYYGRHDDSVWPVVWLILAGAAAWFVSGLPKYYWRRKDRIIARHEAPLRLYPQR